MHRAMRLRSHEATARARRSWRIVGRRRLAPPRPHRLPWTAPPCPPVQLPTAGSITLPLPPWPGFPRSLWLKEELLPALRATSRSLGLPDPH